MINLNASSRDSGGFERPPKVDRLPQLLAYGEAYELAAGNVDAMHEADVAYFNAETAADIADAAAYSAAYRSTLDAAGRAYYASMDRAGNTIIWRP
jgi:hypothetical protein